MSELGMRIDVWLLLPSSPELRVVGELMLAQEQLTVENAKKKKALGDEVAGAARSMSKLAP